MRNLARLQASNSDGHLFMYLFVYLFIYLSIYLFIYLSIYVCSFFKIDIYFFIRFFQPTT